MVLTSPELCPAWTVKIGFKPEVAAWLFGLQHGDKPGKYRPPKLRVVAPNVVDLGQLVGTLEQHCVVSDGPKIAQRQVAIPIHTVPSLLANLLKMEVPLRMVTEGTLMKSLGPQYGDKPGNPMKRMVQISTVKVPSSGGIKCALILAASRRERGNSAAWFLRDQKSRKSKSL
ncbi:hypothetical protein K438DRAFT_1764408 [Mycena galopus ATCC 62051]|nr:hypothetical protein K438DRAFT_1764408 [Mycena galopus ATCC 62051]